MIKINDTVQFDESKNLSQQTPEFKNWYNQNVNVLINDKLVPDILDEYKDEILNYTKTEDEWFIVNLILTPDYKTRKNIIDEHYKCDQIDGLIQFIKDKFK